MMRIHDDVIIMGMYCKNDYLNYIYNLYLYNIIIKYILVQKDLFAITSRFALLWSTGEHIIVG